jgi:hypothetical protein
LSMSSVHITKDKQDVCVRQYPMSFDEVQ